MKGLVANRKLISIALCMVTLIIGFTLPAGVGASPPGQGAGPTPGQGYQSAVALPVQQPAPASQTNCDGDCTPTPAPQPPPTVVQPEGATPEPPQPQIFRCGSRLPLGRPQQGLLAAGRECGFTFVGKAGWTLRLSAEPRPHTTMTLTLAVYDANQHLIAGPVTGVPGSKTELAILLQSDGEHRGTVSSSSAGFFTFSVSTEYQIRGKPPCGGPVSYATPASASITNKNGKCEHYFQGKPQEQIHIVMVPNRSSVQPELTLKDPAERVWQQSGERKYDTIDIALSTTGRYTLIASDRYGKGTGPYTITITLVGTVPATAARSVAQALPTPAQTAAPAGCNIPISVGNTMTGSLAQLNQRCAYLLLRTAGRTLTLTLEGTSGGLDPYLELVSPDGAVVAVNNDYPGAGKNSQIRYTFPAGGQFKAIVSGNGGASTGSYRLRLGP